MDSPEKEAQQILETAWVAAAGEMRIPIDPIVISIQLGIRVFEGDLDPNIAGMIRKEAGEDPRIIVNSADSPVRQRFTVAHELGHYLIHASNDDKYEWIDRRGPLAASGMDRDEIFANQFAAALLMPANEVRRLHEQGALAGDLALTFNVSVDAMKFRLTNLGLTPNTPRKIA